MKKNILEELRWFLIMTIKALLYFLIVPFSLVALDSLNIQNVFKKNRYFQSRLLFVFLALALSYLVVNFFFDFYESSRIF